MNSQHIYNRGSLAKKPKQVAVNHLCELTDSSEFFVLAIFKFIITEVQMVNDSSASWTLQENQMAASNLGQVGELSWREMNRLILGLYDEGYLNDFLRLLLESQCNL